MLILEWPFTFLRYGQICDLVAVALLEEVTWYLQICKSCFYQVSESQPMGLLFQKMVSKFNPFNVDSLQKGGGRGGGGRQTNADLG